MFERARGGVAAAAAVTTFTSATKTPALRGCLTLTSLEIPSTNF